MALGPHSTERISSIQYNVRSINFKQVERFKNGSNFLIFLKPNSCKCTLCHSVLLHCNVLSLYIFILYCVAQINDDDDDDGK